MSIILPIGLVATALLTFKKSQHDDFDIVKSSVDGIHYKVRKGTSKSSQKKVADLLANLNKKKNLLCRFLENSTTYKKLAGIKRLLRNKEVKLEEVSKKYADQAAYSINKGERIGMCVKSTDGSFEHENTMMFVYLHELSHIMTQTYAHDDNFWRNFGVLIEAAIQCNVYSYQEFGSKPRTYCGHKITHTPYKK